ncbi:hypothetical protein [Streptomyces sp. NPDC056938]|uniref:hypothetical protein n=1 Tax=unclassified Streptomyces TaxID=2593676 RepID=UPI003638D793
MAEARVVSHPHDSALALARAKVLLPDVLVADLSARFTPDSATGVHRARQLSTPCTVVVHGYGAVIGTHRRGGLRRSRTRLHPGHAGPRPGRRTPAGGLRMTDCD